jgi:hypothetical protein
MTQIVEEEKGCSGRAYPGHGMGVIGCGRGLFLEITSPYTPPMRVLQSSALVLYPFTLV